MWSTRGGGQFRHIVKKSNDSAKGTCSPSPPGAQPNFYNPTPTSSRRSKGLNPWYENLQRSAPAVPKRACGGPQRFSRLPLPPIKGSRSRYTSSTVK